MNDSSPTSTTAFAAPTRKSPAREIEKLGEYLNEARANSDALSGHALSKRYFGNYREHPSFFIHGLSPGKVPAPPSRLSPFVQTLGHVHVALRKLPMLLPRLDRKSLDDDTQYWLNQLLGPEGRPQEGAEEGVVAQYQKICKAIDACEAGERREALISKRLDLQKTAGEILDNLKTKSQLRPEEEKIPLLVGENTHENISNANWIGLKLLALKLSAKSLNDERILPPELLKFCRDYTGEATKTLESMETLFETTEVKSYYDAAVSQTVQQIKKALEAGKHPLQLQHLVVQPQADYSESLLEAAGIPRYPEHLHSLVECALVLHALAQQTPGGYPPLLYSCCKDMAEGKQDEQYAAKLKAVAEDIITPHANDRPDPRRNMQIKLLQDFLERSPRLQPLEAPQDELARGK